MSSYNELAINRGRGGHGETAIGLAAPVGQTASQSYEDSRKVLRGSHTHSNLDLNRQPPFATNSSPNSSREAQVGGTTLYSGSGGAARHVRRSVGAFCGTPQPNISQPSPQPGFNTYPPAAQQPPFANFANNHSMGYGPAAWAANRPHVPMSSDPQIVSWFKSQDRNNRGLINDLELRSALMNGDRTNFDIDTIRMLMTLFDTNRSGEIDEQEFQGIWGYLREWQDLFSRFDRDRSGCIDELEIQQALQQLGYPLPQHTVSLFQRKYENTRNDEVQPRAGCVTFAHFIRICVAVKAFTDSFRRFDPSGNAHIYIQYNHFLDMLGTLP